MADPKGPSNNLLLVISAPSGAGKTTVCQQLLKSVPGMVRAITCTTRAPRTGEQDGVDYYFLEAADFLKRVQAGNFLEHATVYGNSYGTLKAEILGKLRAGKDVVLSVDVQGVTSIKQRASEDPELRQSLVTVFLAPPNIATLEERLVNRGTDTPQVIQKRLREARQEIMQSKHFDYVILSGTMEEDFNRTRAIVSAEKLRQSRVRLPEYAATEPRKDVPKA